MAAPPTQSTPLKFLTGNYSGALTFARLRTRDQCAEYFGFDEGRRFDQEENNAIVRKWGKPQVLLKAPDNRQTRRKGETTRKRGTRVRVEQNATLVRLERAATHEKSPICFVLTVRETRGLAPGLKVAMRRTEIRHTSDKMGRRYN